MHKDALILDLAAFARTRPLCFTAAAMATACVSALLLLPALVFAGALAGAVLGLALAACFAFAAGRFATQVRA